MSTSYDCARCTRTHEGRRLIIEQSATDDTGLHTLVEKCWTLCPACAEKVMALVGEASPWCDDARTVVLPDTSPDEPAVRVFALTRS